MNPIVFLLLIASFSCFQVRLAIPDGISLSPQQLYDLNNLRISINSLPYFIYPFTKNAFHIPNLPVGRSMLEIVSHTLVFPIIIVDQRANTEPSINILHPHTRRILQKSKAPVLVAPIEKLNYVEMEQGFSLMGFLFSGTGLFIMAGLGLYMCYKKILPTLQEAQQAPE